MAERTWAVIAGGGTAGHVLPALSAAKALVARGHSPESIHFVGSRRGLEATLVPAEGFSVTLLPGRGIARRLTLDNVGAVFGLLGAVVQGLVLVFRLRPAVVLSVGGYASVPCALAAVVLRVPLVLHDQNAVPGLANRLAGRFARAAAVSFPGTPLPRAVVTGNPVRDEVRSVPGRATARAALGLPDDRFVVGVFGGSLGARSINRAVVGWAGRDDTVVYHVVGRRDWAEMSTPVGPWHRPVEYEQRLPLLLAAADIVVCRAGGTTVAELAVVGVPAVLVPLPYAPGDHQTANARALVDAGGAVLVRDDELSPERLDAELSALLASRLKLESMADAARSVGVPDAADRLAAVVEAHARRCSGPSIRRSG
ncbi:MAG TPA: undecaprenyldiphospho-muramoylpentapeptide beta-N-acetylglucosaminyltransferase, partial [Acidimicrobiales bacterium]|nr:undecaprenyldiphospho-muramoylpentapeptide beta-N-acetylglucosaminyltransferase [Acidimicrobiales bacterium]